MDGSTDGSDACLAEFPFPILRNPVNRGIGHSLRNVIRYGRENGFQILTFVGGNAKNDPNQAPRLVVPLQEGRADYVQGSRFLPGAEHHHTPLARLVMVKVHARAFGALTGRRLTDALEGVRAYRLNLFDDERLDIHQEWLDGYEMETYIHYHVLMSADRYRYLEVPVSKIYPENARGFVLNRGGKQYSHIRPVVDWWKIVRPVVYLKLGLRK